MQMHDASRVEIIIEAIMERRLCDRLVAAGVTGFTVLPVHAGSGRSGHWEREGQVSRASGMVAVLCLIRPERVESLLEAVFPLLERHIGIVSVSDAKVIRAERF